MAGKGGEMPGKSFKPRDPSAAGAEAFTGEYVDDEATGLELSEVAILLERTLFEAKRVLVGQDRMLERMMVCLLARGHCLLEGVPGLAKTLAVETLARAVRGSFVRIQFTPDLVPSDIVGSTIFKSDRSTFDVVLGPVFANFVLADEINRAPAKVQSALLEVMSEQQATINGVSYPAPEPFFVLATQNPIESEGVYPLPEAQRDRFLMKILVPYPTPTEELEIINRMGVDPPRATPVLDATELLALQRAVDMVFVHQHIAEYAVRLVYASRDPLAFEVEGLDGLIAFGASPRASLGLVASARALALLRGREYVLPQDVTDLAPDILRHRLVLTFDAVADGIDVEAVLDRLLTGIAPPDIAPSQNRLPLPSAQAS